MDTNAPDAAPSVRAVMLPTGSGNLEALRTAPRLLGPELQRWNEAVRV